MNKELEGILQAHKDVLECSGIPDFSDGAPADFMRIIVSGFALVLDELRKLNKMEEMIYEQQRTGEGNKENRGTEQAVRYEHI